MNQQLLIQLSEGLLLLVAGIGLIIVVLASVYDLRLIARRSYFRATVTKLRKPRQPHVTVLVYAKNSQATIEACLASIARSTYRNYDIVVVGNVSIDTTKQFMVNYRQKRPSLPLYFYAKRKASDKLSALQQGYKKSQGGDSVLVIDAASTIPSTLLEECAARFVADDTLSVLQLNGHIKEAQSINLLWLRFAGLSQNMYAKAASLLSIWHVRTGESNVMYSSLVFMQQQGGPKVMDVSCRYEGSLVVATMPMPQSRSAFLSFPIMWWGALAPALFLLTYFFYIAATLQSSSLLILSWLILTIWLLAAVLSDEASKVFEKIRLTFCLPALYFLLYAQLVIYAVMRIVRAVALAAFGQTLVHRQGTWLAERKL